jgi:hypothetical protein
MLPTFATRCHQTITKLIRITGLQLQQGYRFSKTLCRSVHSSVWRPCISRCNWMIRTAYSETVHKEALSTTARHSQTYKAHGQLRVLNPAEAYIVLTFGILSPSLFSFSSLLTFTDTHYVWALLPTSWCTNSFCTVDLYKATGTAAALQV